MSAGTYGAGLIFLGAGCALGWYANRTFAAHGDIKSTKKRIIGYRKTRHHNGVLALIIAFVLGIIVFGLIHPHR